MKDIALPIINAALQDVSLPDVSLDEHVPVVGHVKVTLSSIKMSGFRLPSAALTVSSPPHFSMDMSGAWCHHMRVVTCRVFTSHHDTATQA